MCHSEPIRNPDKDVEFLTRFEAKAEIVRLRNGVRKFIHATGNDLCHENRQELADLLPEKPKTHPRPLPFFRFMWNCLKYRWGLIDWCKNGTCSGGPR
jgi:hypothetical protein